MTELSKEEILKQFSNEHSYEDWGELMYDTHNISQIEYTRNVMDIYADQQKKKASIEFAKFIKNGGYHGELIVTEDLWFDEDNNEIGDTEQLYSLFEQQKTK